MEVRERVEREAGREFGGEVRLLFVMYLLISFGHFSGKREGTYNVPREVSWIRDGTGPSRLLNDKSLDISSHPLIMM